MPASPEPQSSLPRPGLITAVGWTIAAGSVMAVLGVLETAGSLHTLDVRERISNQLDTGVYADLGVTVEGWLRALRVALYVAGVSAAATAVLGFYVLRRNRGARIAASIAAVPLLLTVPITGSLLALVVAVAVAMLWGPVAQDWFAGRPQRPLPGREPSAGEDRRGQTGWPPPSDPWGAPHPDGRHEDLPPPTGHPAPPPAGPPVAGPDAPPPSRIPFGAAAPQPPGVIAQVPERRPGQLVAACVVTWVFAGLTAVIALLIAVMVVVDREGVLELARAQSGWEPGMEDAVGPQLVAALVLVAFWCAAAATFAAFAWRRRRWGLLGMLFSTFLVALLSLAAFPASIIQLGGSALVIGLIFSPSVTAWFATAGRRGDAAGRR